MTLLTSTGAGVLAPETVQNLVIQPLIDEAICTQVSTVVQTSSNSTRFPVVKSDPTAAWTPEAAEIAVSDADIDEINVVPSKLAGLTVISNELAQDSSPAALNIVGSGLIRDLKTRLDAAFFANTTANGPDGLESLTGVTSTSPLEALTNLDWAIEAITQAETQGAKVTAFVAHPTLYETFLLARTTADSNQTLLGTDATSPTKRSVYGVPLFSSTHVPAGRVWAIDKSKVFVVIRSGATVVTDTSAYFSSDRTAVRCVLRVGFGFPHEAALVSVGVGGS